MRMSSEIVNLYWRLRQTLAPAFPCTLGKSTNLVWGWALTGSVWKMPSVNVTRLLKSRIDHGRLWEGKPWAFCGQHWSGHIDEDLQRLPAGIWRAQAERNSFRVLFKNCAVSSETETQKVQLDCVSHWDMKYVRISLTILKSSANMKGLETRKLDPFYETPKHRWNCREAFLATKGMVLSEEVSITPVSAHCHISSGKLLTIYFEKDVEFLCCTVRNVFLNQWSCFFLEKKKWNALASMSCLSKRSVEDDFVVQFQTMLMARKEKLVKCVLLLWDMLSYGRVTFRTSPIGNAQESCR